MNRRLNARYLGLLGWVAAGSLIAGTVQARDLGEHGTAAVFAEDFGVRLVGRDIDEKQVLVARIAGPDGSVTERELVSNSEAWVQAGKDGVYKYEIVAEPKVLVNGSGPGPSDHNGRSLAVASKMNNRAAQFARSGAVQSGSFTVIGGRVVDASLAE